MKIPIAQTRLAIALALCVLLCGCSGKTIGNQASENMILVIFTMIASFAGGMICERKSFFAMATRKRASQSGLKVLVISDNMAAADLILKRIGPGHHITLLKGVSSIRSHTLSGYTFNDSTKKFALNKGKFHVAFIGGDERSYKGTKLQDLIDSLENYGIRCDSLYIDESGKELIKRPYWYGGL
jgi:hypothetical protein